MKSQHTGELCDRLRKGNPAKRVNEWPGPDVRTRAVNMNELSRSIRVTFAQSVARSGIDTKESPRVQTG